jgi:hypothetical protein
MQAACAVSMLVSCSGVAACGRLTTMVGNGLNVIKVMPESAIKFGSYEASTSNLSR